MNDDQDPVGNQEAQQEEEAVDNTAALTQVLQGILTWLNNAGAPPAAQPRNTSHTPIYDLYGHTNPHDLNTKMGLTAYQDSCKSITNKWDGTVEKFPPFLIELRRRFEEYNWDASGSSGITKIGGKDILKEYHSITTAMIADASLMRNNNRAIQNNRAFYKLLISSVTSDVIKVLFETADGTEKPIKDDGLDLFIKMIKTTTLASIQTSIKATNKLTAYCPSKAKFKIPQVNADINHHVILATTATRKLEDVEQISITMAIYDKIKQPQEWVSWLQQKKIEFNKGQLTKCVSFQAEAVTTYNQIMDDNKEGKFKASTQTVEEEVIAMLIEKAKPAPKRTIRGTPKNDNSNDTDEKTNSGTSRPPFLLTKQSAAGLADTFQDNFLVGTALKKDQIMEKDLAVDRIIQTHFNVIVPVNCMKAESIHPRLGQFKWELADAFVEYGIRHNMHITVHNLAWHSQTPDWYFQDENGNDLGRDDMIERMREHITTIMQR